MDNPHDSISGEGGVNKVYVSRLVSEILNAMKFVETITLKAFHELTEVEKYAIRYNLIVIAEALETLSLHLARRLSKHLKLQFTL